MAFKPTGGGKGTNLTPDQIDAINNLRDSDGELVWEVVNVDGKEEVQTHLTTQGGLNSFKLGGKHISASGSENVFWTNLGSGTHWFPAWQGLKDQSVVDNQDASGIHMPTARLYSRNMARKNSSGIPEASPLNYVAYDSVVTFPNAVSGFGISIRSGLVINVGDLIVVRATDNATGLAIFSSEVVTPNAIAVGEMFDLWFDKPTEVLDNTTVTVNVTVKRGIGGTTEPMLVSADTSGFPFDVGMVRSFTDIPLELAHVNFVDEDDVVYYNTTFAVDTSTTVVTLTVDPQATVTKFTVFDNAENFNTNSCFVVIGGDTYELDKKDKQYDFSLDGATWHWSEINRKAK